MDELGLDVALVVEEHYAEIRDGTPQRPRDYCGASSTKVVWCRERTCFYDDYAAS